MNSTFIGLMNNVALLLTLGLLYDTTTLKPRVTKPSIEQLRTGEVEFEAQDGVTCHLRFRDNLYTVRV